MGNDNSKSKNKAKQHLESLVTAVTSPPSSSLSSLQNTVNLLSNINTILQTLQGCGTDDLQEFISAVFSTPKEDPVNMFFECLFMALQNAYDFRATICVMDLVLLLVDTPGVELPITELAKLALGEAAPACVHILQRVVEYHQRGKIKENLSVYVDRVDAIVQLFAQFRIFCTVFVSRGGPQQLSYILGSDDFDEGTRFGAAVCMEEVLRFTAFTLAFQKEHISIFTRMLHPEAASGDKHQSLRLQITACTLVMVFAQSAKDGDASCAKNLHLMVTEGRLLSVLLRAYKALQRGWNSPSALSQEAERSLVIAIESVLADPWTVAYFPRGGIDIVLSALERATRFRLRECAKLLASQPPASTPKKRNANSTEKEDNISSALEQHAFVECYCTAVFYRLSGKPEMHNQLVSKGILRVVLNAIVSGDSSLELVQHTKLLAVKCVRNLASTDSKNIKSALVQQSKFPLLLMQLGLEEDPLYIQQIVKILHGVVHADYDTADRSSVVGLIVFRAIVPPIAALITKLVDTESMEGRHVVIMRSSVDILNQLSYSDINVKDMKDVLDTNAISTYVAKAQHSELQKAWEKLKVTLQRPLDINNILSTQAPMSPSAGHNPYSPYGPGSPASPSGRFGLHHALLTGASLLHEDRIPDSPTLLSRCSSRSTSVASTASIGACLSPYATRTATERSSTPDSDSLPSSASFGEARMLNLDTVELEELNLS